MIDPHRFMLFCVGAQKAGTSSLFSSLSRHFQVLGLPEKEVHFFDYQDWSNNEGYVQRFIDAGSFRQRSSWKPIWGLDASPSYLFHPLVAFRISQVFPRARILVSLRNPVKRAYSHYFHNVRAGRERRSFSDAIRNELDSPTLSPEAEAWDDPGASIRHYSYLRRGLYAEQLERYSRHFPDNQIKVIFAEDFFREPEIAMTEIAEFIAIKPNFRGRYIRWNIGSYDPKALAPNHEEVKNFFAEPNLALAELLKRKLPWT